MSKPKHEAWRLVRCAAIAAILAAGAGLPAQAAEAADNEARVGTRAHGRTAVVAPKPALGHAQAAAHQVAAAPAAGHGAAGVVAPTPGHVTHGAVAGGAPRPAARSDASASHPARPRAASSRRPRP